MVEQVMNMYTFPLEEALRNIVLLVQVQAMGLMLNIITVVTVKAKDLLQELGVNLVKRFTREAAEAEAMAVRLVVPAVAVAELVTPDQTIILL